MKTTPKGIAVTVLAICAVLLAVWTVFGDSIMRRRAASTAAASRPAAPAPSTPAPRRPARPEAVAATPPPGTRRAPDTAIDVAYVQANLARWMEAPARDPFAVYLPASNRSSGPRADELLSLHAIWRQTGGQLAVINGRIVAEGDRIAGFQVEAIEKSLVRVRGSNGVEKIEFSGGRPRPNRTNALANAGTPRPAAGNAPARDRKMSP